MKKKILISSIATIALCLCLVAGSTFALFTETTTVNIAVTAGDLDVEAAIVADSLKGHSLNGTFPATGSALVSFENGGSAKFENNELKINKMTPGDAVSFDVTVKNTGDVAAMYTVAYAFDAVTAGTAEEALKNALEITVKTNGNEFTGADTYATLGAPESETTFTVTVTFPNGDPAVDNACQGAEDLGITFTVEAVQENGVKDDGTLYN